MYEPVEIRVNPDGIEIISYPGPDASVRTKALNEAKIVARRYRNRRIGDFLKELDLTEGRCTGIPTIRAAMAENGSLPVQYSTDEDRTHILVELPVHPLWEGIDPSYLADGAHDGGHDLSMTEGVIMLALSTEPRNTAQLASELGYSRRTRNVRDALAKLIGAGLVGLTIPGKPRSKNQKMRITDRGRARLRKG